MSSTDKNAEIEKNVRVAVRIRPMNDKETVEKARCSLRTNLRKQTIVVTDRGTTRINKEFGPFDKVYGMQAKQLHIYSDLVKPLVRNALAGYNCTLFAYGQTSTGKTFTMEGEQISSTYEGAWNEDSLVGIIPRALQHIFTELEKDAKEFSVRASYVELYNEELYDLLGNAELGHARLRLFEDSVRKGSVIVSGLKEVLVADRLEARELLKKGAEKRRTATTLMNLNSSRSHTVFTITVSIRESSVSGEEVIKQGKLNLIDLAGSENIVRSGSTNKRAREAGSINQSLLTLGRVIMALKSGARHVPYRESKLTRILQDSLGGKTITTIVATLSPASTNIEESIRTLEYASAAKNIKNQPEINQELTHHAVLKAYNNEISRLARDLQDARNKTGSNVNRQNYKKMNTQLEEKNQLIDTLTDELESVLERIQSHIQEIEYLNQHYGRLYTRYRYIEQKYEQRCNENAQLRLELANCKSNLEIHQSVLKKLQESANQSRAQNDQLRENCMHWDSELYKAHDEIDAFRNATNENEKLYAQYTRSSAQSTDKLKKDIKAWNKMSQLEMKKITDFCERTKLSINEDVHVFRDHIELFRSRLIAFFTAREGDIDNSVISFLKEVCTFINDIQNNNEKLYDQHNKFIDFIAKHVEEYELLGKNYYEVSIDYATLSMSMSEEMKQMLPTYVPVWITDVLETYIKTIKEETEQVSEKLKSLKVKQQSNFERHCACVKATVDETCSIKAAWKSLIHDFSRKMTCLREHIENTHKTMEALCEDLQDQGNLMSAHVNEMANSNTDVAIYQMQLSKVKSSSLLEEVNKAHLLTEEFIKRNIVRPSTIGETSVRKEKIEFPKPVEIPDAYELINRTNEKEAPRRLSQYRRRDSILEKPFTILSPDALKESLKRDLDEILEAPESSSEHDNVAAVNSKTTR